MGSLLENSSGSSKPLGIRFSEYIRRATISYSTYQAIVLILTFFAYASYHATRKTTSIVKSVLDPQSSKLGYPRFLLLLKFIEPTHQLQEHSPLLGGWAPFDNSDGTTMLGQIDVAFLAVYSLGMYFAGHLGDRLNLRIFLTVGMVGTGIFTALFGAGYWLNIHIFYYFLGIQMLAGLFQSTGWPSVLAVVGNWFGKSKRGLIMGIWNAHTSVGNISGSLIASALLKYGWGWSFAIPGLLIFVMGVMVFLFLPVSPDSMGLDKEDEDTFNSCEKDGFSAPFLGERTKSEDKAVGFIEAWKIPAIHTVIGGKYLSDSSAGTLSTMFDVGGVLGGILAGHISDRLDARAITAASFMYCAIPALFFYRAYGSISIYWNVGLMFIAGMFVNGPYALITTAVSADLGTHSSLNGNSRALATVTAIIDGTGSVGAAIGPLVTGYISASSWNDVFTMLMGAAFIAGLLLTKLVIAEVTSKLEASTSLPSMSIPISRPPLLISEV